MPFPMLLEAFHVTKKEEEELQDLTTELSNEF